jgi:Flp pilus assembly pilin Flp
MATIRRFMTDESGATAVEYGLLVALIHPGR